MKIVDHMEFKEGRVSLIKQAESNVIGKGGWSVTVSKPFCTKQLNYTNEAEAYLKYHSEVLELISE